MGRTRLSSIALSKVGGLEEGLVVVAISGAGNLTKGKQYILRRGGTYRHALYYVLDDRGHLCSEMKFFAHLKDWRDIKLKDLGI